MPSPIVHAHYMAIRYFEYKSHITASYSVFSNGSPWAWNKILILDPRLQDAIKSPTPALLSNLISYHHPICLPFKPHQLPCCSANRQTHPQLEMMCYCICLEHFYPRSWQGWFLPKQVLAQTSPSKKDFLCSAPPSLPSQSLWQHPLLVLLAFKYLVQKCPVHCVLFNHLFPTYIQVLWKPRLYLCWLLVPRRVTDV